MKKLDWCTSVLFQDNFKTILPENGFGDLFDTGEDRAAFMNQNNSFLWFVLCEIVYASKPWKRVVNGVSPK